MQFKKAQSRLYRDPSEALMPYIVFNAVTKRVSCVVVRGCSIFAKVKPDMQSRKSGRGQALSSR